MKHKQLLINLIFAVVVLGIAGGWFAWRAAHRTGAAALAAALTYGDANTVLDLISFFVNHLQDFRVSNQRSRQENLIQQT